MIRHLFPVPLIFHFYQSTCGLKKKKNFSVYGSVPFCGSFSASACFLRTCYKTMVRRSQKNIPQGSNHCLSNVGAFQIPMILMILMSDKNISNLPWRDPFAQSAPFAQLLHVQHQPSLLPSPHVGTLRPSPTPLKPPFNKWLHLLMG